jgi:hypothetical protein
MNVFRKIRRVFLPSFSKKQTFGLPRGDVRETIDVPGNMQHSECIASVGLGPMGIHFGGNAPQGRCSRHHGAFRKVMGLLWGRGPPVFK